jgi:hypothetical protein
MLGLDGGDKQVPAAKFLCLEQVFKYRFGVKNPCLWVLSKTMKISGFL